MFLRTTALVFAFCLSTLVISAPSNPPAPRPTVGGTDKQEHPATANTKPQADKRGTSEQPLVVQSAETEESKKARDEETAARKISATNERVATTSNLAIAWLTGIAAVVAIGQLVMFWWQLKLMRDGAKEATTAVNAAIATASATKIAADASKVSSSALMAAQRAYVSVKPGMLNQSITDNTLMLSLAVENVGFTPAFNLSICGRLVILDAKWSVTDALPTLDEFQNINVTVFPRSLPSVGTTPIPITNAEIQQFRDKQRYLHAIGRVRYTDTFGNDCFTNFFSRCDWNADGSCLWVSMPAHNEAT